MLIVGFIAILLTYTLPDIIASEQVRPSPNPKPQPNLNPASPLPNRLGLTLTPTPTLTLTITSEQGTRLFKESVDLEQHQIKLECREQVS